jgi:hypothetical protein
MNDPLTPACPLAVQRERKERRAALGGGGLLQSFGAAGAEGGVFGVRADLSFPMPAAFAPSPFWGARVGGCKELPSAASPCAVGITVRGVPVAAQGR